MTSEIDYLTSETFKILITLMFLLLLKAVVVISVFLSFHGGGHFEFRAYRPLESSGTLFAVFFENLEDLSIRINALKTCPERFYYALSWLYTHM